MWEEGRVKRSLFLGWGRFYEGLFVGEVFVVRGVVRGVIRRFWGVYEIVLRRVRVSVSCGFVFGLDSVIKGFFVYRRCIFVY